MRSLSIALTIFSIAVLFNSVTSRAETAKRDYGVIKNQDSPYAKLKSVDLKEVHWTDGFWAENAKLTINRKSVKVPCKPASYTAIERKWAAGDVIELDLPMPVRMIMADPRVEQTRNQVAVMRGPVVYCLESIDVPQEIRFEDICLAANAKWKVQHEPELLGGVTVLKTKAMVIDKTTAKDVGGYRQVSDARPRRIDIRMIPYYAWNNRQEPKMTVWLPVRW